MVLLWLLFFDVLLAFTSTLSARLYCFSSWFRLIRRPPPSPMYYFSCWCCLIFLDPTPQSSKSFPSATHAHFGLERPLIASKMQGFEFSGKSLCITLPIKVCFFSALSQLNMTWYSSFVLAIAPTCLNTRDPLNLSNTEHNEGSGLREGDRSQIRHI